MGNTREGSAQYKDIQVEIERLDELIFEHQRELLAIKCAALSSCKHFSKSAKKIGFVTNGAYKDYIIEQFMKDNLSSFSKPSFLGILPVAIIIYLVLYLALFVVTVLYSSLFESKIFFNLLIYKLESSSDSIWSTSVVPSASSS